MTPNEKTIRKFYKAFANGNASQMCKCYHPNVKFRDPVFGLLKGKEVGQMWKMLIENSKGNLKIDFTEVKAAEFRGSALWTATYNFSKTNRKVVNSIHARFQFQDGLIINHNDEFDIWNWAKQALGIKGMLLGWTGFMHKRIQEQAHNSLKKYRERNVV